MSRRERIIELAREIDATRGKLHAMEAEMDSLLPTEEPAAREVSAIRIETGVPMPQTLTERVIGFLEQNPRNAFTAAGVASGIQLSDDRITSLRSTLVRLVKEERIDRPSPGAYRAKQVQHHAAA
jgi:hypothetical protein